MRAGHLVDGEAFAGTEAVIAEYHEGVSGVVIPMNGDRFIAKERCKWFQA